MAHPLHTTVEDFVAGLLQQEALAAYTWWSDDRYMRNLPERQNVVGLDCLGGATEITMEPLQRDEFAGSEIVATVDKIQTIHRILNEDKADGAISLHIYSRPFDSCVAFDLDNQRCFRRALSYYSQFGQKLA
jgi:cysteine dioxygenase